MKPMTAQSLPLRGAWIEMKLAGGLALVIISRSPCGGRGLKSLIILGSAETIASLPLRGAWIEMSRSYSDFVRQTVAPLAGGVD